MAAKPGIKKMDSGLLMETVTAGTGASPTATDTVKVNYKGALLDGTVFDSSEKHGGTADDADGPDRQVLGGRAVGNEGGWEGEALLPVRDRVRRPPDGQIPPGATLQFDVELVEIVKPEAAAKP
jgi:hypothetical protein